MRFKPQYKLSALLVVTFVTAIACSLALPFNPTVTFLQTSASVYSEGGEQWPAIDFKVRNDGLFPIWYHRGTDMNCTGLHLWQRPHQETAEDVYYMEDKNDWQRLDPGSALTANVLFDSNATELKIGIEFGDWRGRTAQRWSPVTDPISLHQRMANHPLPPSGEAGRFEMVDQSSPPADR